MTGRAMTTGMALVLLVLLWQPGTAGVGVHIEDFSATTYMDGESTTAWWDTASGTLRLYPFQPSYAGSFNALGGTANGLAVSGNYAYIANGDSGLLVIDIADPESPLRAPGYGPPSGHASYTGSAHDVAVAGNTAFVANGSGGLLCLSIENPRAAALLGEWDTGTAKAVELSGNYAYVASEDSGLVVVDIADPGAPSRAGRVGLAESAHGVSVYGDYAFVATDFGVHSIDISDPTAPAELDVFVRPGEAYDVAVSGRQVYVSWSAGEFYSLTLGADGGLSEADMVSSGTGMATLAVGITGNYAYLAQGDSGVVMVDIGDPSSMEVIGRYTSVGVATGLCVAADYAYVTDEDSCLAVIDIADPVIPPALEGELLLPGVPSDVKVVGDLAFVTDRGEGELNIVDVTSPSNPQVLVTVDAPGEPRAIAISGDHAYVAATDPALIVLDVSDPASPTLGGSFVTPSEARSVAVSDNHAYVVDAGPGAADFNGLHAIDVSNPDSALVLTGSAHLDGSGRSANSVAVSGDYAYVADWAQGLRAVEITSPGVLGSVTSQDTPGLAYDVAVHGNYAYVADGEAGLQVIDIRGLPDTLSLVSTCDTPGTSYAVKTDGTLAFVADGSEGLQVIDISNPDTLEIVGHCGMSGFAYGLAVEGDYVFVAGGTYGVFAVDVSDSTNPAVVDSLCLDSSEGCDVRCLDIAGGNLYVADHSLSRTPDFWVIDASAPDSLEAMGSCWTPGNASSVTVSGSYAFVTDDVFGLWMIDISDLSKPVLLNAFATAAHSQDVLVDGNHVYLTDFKGHWNGGLRAIDVSTPSRPVLLGTSDDSTIAYVGGIAVSGDHAFIADTYKGFHVVDISNPPSTMPVIGEDATKKSLNVAIDGDFAYVTNPYYRFIVYDVRDPYNPLLKVSHGFRSVWPAATYGVAVTGNYACATAGADGLWILDIRDPIGPSTLQATGGEYAVYEMPNAWGVDVDGDHAFVADLDEGLVILRIFSREYDLCSNHAQSTVMPGISGVNRDIVRCRLTPDATALSQNFEWYVTADGAHWQEEAGGGEGVVFEFPGRSLKWRAKLMDDPTGTETSCDTLTVEWWHNSAVIDTIIDVPQDHGGWVRLSFVRSGYDFAGTTSPLDTYHIWRKTDPGVPSILNKVDALSIGKTKTASSEKGVIAALRDLGKGFETFVVDGRLFMTSASDSGTWEMVQSVPALQQEKYEVAVPTFLNGEETWFTVSAHREDPTLWYMSPPASGISVLDSMPAPPAMVMGEYLGNHELQIRWSANTQADFSHYTVYKGISADFESSEDCLLAKTADTLFVDTGFEPDRECYYKVSAWDVHENESRPTLLGPDGITGLDRSYENALFQNVPNPFTGSTRIAFTLKEEGHVRLRVFDVKGRLVRTLVDGARRPDRYVEVWDGRNDEERRMASGMYFYELEVAGYDAVRKMMLIRR